MFYLYYLNCQRILKTVLSFTKVCTLRLSLVRPERDWFPGIEEIQVVNKHTKQRSVPRKDPRSLLMKHILIFLPALHPGIFSFHLSPFHSNENFRRTCRGPWPRYLPSAGARSPPHKPAMAPISRPAAAPDQKTRP